MKQKISFEVDKRNQELVRKAKVKDGKGEDKSWAITEDRWKKKSAKKFKDSLDNQYKNIKKFIEKAEKCKEMSEKKEKLKYYKEIKNVLDAIEWEHNEKLKNQYELAKKQFEGIKEQKEQLDKVWAQLRLSYII